MQILGLSGSLRAGSHNAALLRAAAALLRPPARLVPFAHLREIPPYDEDATSSRRRWPWPSCVHTSRPPTRY